MAEAPEIPGGQGSPQPPPFQPVATQSQPVATPGAAAPPPLQAPAKSGGSSALKIVLIVVGVIVVLVMLVVGVIGYIGWRVVHSVHVNSTNGTVSVNTPGGKFTADSGEKFTASELGTDIYPGAEPAKEGNLRMSVASSSVISAKYLTTDPKSKVVDFYKQKLGSDASVLDMGATAILTLKKSPQEQISVTIAQDANQNGGKTQIGIMHTTDTQAK